MELRRLSGHRVGLFSGVEFSVDEAKGLSGFCDFIVSRSPELYVVTAPVVVVVEAKKENLSAGFGQCLAEMVAAREFNQREESTIPTVYGAVTTGTNWKFLTLTGDAAIDLVEYRCAPSLEDRHPVPYAELTGAPVRGSGGGETRRACERSRPSRGLPMK